MKKFFVRHLTLIIFLVIIFLGLFLRVNNLNDNIFFGYDQARDFQRISKIVEEGDIKLLGPETYIPGLYNSPLYYYILIPTYILFQGNPNSAVLLLILANVIVSILLYKFAEVIFNNRWPGIIAAFLWTVSFEQANFARHLSNASLMSVFTILYFLGLAMYFLKKKHIGLIFSVIGLALATHMNIYLIYLAFFYPLFYLIYQPKNHLKTYVTSAVLFIGLLSSFILAELKYRFMGIKSLLAFMASSHGESTWVMENITNYIQKITEAVYYSFFSFNYFWAFLFLVLFVYLFVKATNKKSALFILLISLSTLPLFSYKSSILETAIINSSIFAPLTLIVSGGIYYLLQKKGWKAVGIATLIIIAVSNILLFIQDDFNSMKRVAYQNLTLKDEKAMLDYTYSSAQKGKFSVCAITNPLFVNTIWSYLYHWYGNQTYGYTPTWSGQKQINLESLIPYDTEHVKTRYLIIEPMIGIPEIAKKATIYLEDQVSVIEDQKRFGDIIVQKRRLEPNKKLLQDSQELTPEEVKSIKINVKIDPRYSCYLNY